jgi:alkanesulfonate monooxygenase SsuD/methylene tetrahydromethanopterin reductase-like flavin-dependent oxidoreductase (luciferase family)
MKLAVLISTNDWQELRSFALEAERMGIDSLWKDEFIAHDSFTPLAYLAPLTSTIRLGTGVVTMGGRSPAALAMSAMSVASMSGGRFILGIGAGAKAMFDGWHGVPFHPPAQNLRETIELVRLIARGDEARYSGRLYSVGGPFALRADPAALAEFPVYVAALSPKSLRVTGEIADGWVGGMSFMPEMAPVWFDDIAAGAARAGRSIADLDLMAPTFMSFGDVEAALAMWKPFIGNWLGQSASGTNSHAGAYIRSGHGERIEALGRAVASGDGAAAAALVPDEWVLQSKLVGDDGMIRERVRAYRDAGITTLQVYSFANPITADLEPLARLKAILDEVNAEAELAPA